MLKKYSTYAVLIALFYTFLYVNNVVLYKIINIWGIQISASSLIFPATYLVIDIITEIYGFEAAKQLIWQSTIFNLLFSLLIYFLILLPSPEDWKLQPSFAIVFNNIVSITIMHTLAAPLSYFINAYILSKWKIFTQGRLFWVRSVNSSIIGEICFSIFMGYFIWYGHTKTFIIELVITTYIAKLVWALIGGIPAALICTYIKKHNKIDTYDYNVAYNPFTSK